MARKSKTDEQIQNREEIKQRFLSDYIGLESFISQLPRFAQGNSIFSYADTLEEGDEKRRLHFCRTVRNALSHEQDDGFYIVTEGMCEFLEDEFKKLSSGTAMVKDVMLTPSRAHAARWNDAVIDAAKKVSMSKQGLIPVLSGDGSLKGLLTARAALSAMMKDPARPMSRSGIKLSQPGMTVKTSDIAGPAREKMAENGAAVAVVIEGGEFKGIMFQE